MDYVALKLNEKTLDDKLTLTTDLAASLVTNIATYATPDPATTVLTGKVTAIAAKRTELATAQTVLDTKTGELAALELDLDNTLMAEAAYIQKASGGVASKITLLGLDVKGTPAGVTPPGAVTGFKLSAGDNPGEVKTCCKPASGAQGYEYQMTTDPNTESSWKLFDTSSGCRQTLTGLTSGTKIWVRVRAVGGKKTGKGPWSDPATITVP
jgi:hypothetical protein